MHYGVKTNTYTEPWSVVGGASRSGFWMSIHLFCGPRTVAPSPPRIASGFTLSSSWFHAGPLGSSLAYGNVAEGSAAVAAEVGDGAVDGAAALTDDDSEAAGADTTRGAKSASARKTRDADRMAISG